MYPVYSDKSYLDSIIDKFKELVTESYTESDTLLQVIYKIEGKDTIPIMTIHKSKGLEYDVVIFIGLEDSAFWNYKNQTEEDTCTFFVAMSRAKEKLIFSFSKNRTIRHGNSTPQGCENIMPMYQALLDSGLVELIDKTKG